MSSSSFSRRHLLRTAGVTAVASAAGPALLRPEPAAAAVVPPARADIGVSAYPFDLGRVRLSSGRLLDMRLTVQATNDNANVAAVTYGPVVLSGNYGTTTLSALPTLNTGSISRTSTSSLAFSATANGATVALGPFYDAHGHNYTVYWNTAGGSGGGTYRLVNAGTGLVLGVQNMSTGDNARVLQWADNGTADHRWSLVDNGDGTYRIRNANSGKLLGILNSSTAWVRRPVQKPDSGAADTRWRLTR